MEQPSVRLTRWGSAGPVAIVAHGNAQGSEAGGNRRLSKQAAHGVKCVGPGLHEGCPRLHYGPRLRRGSAGAQRAAGLVP